MIKTNQILSLGWILSVEKIWEKLRPNQQPSLKRYVKCAIQSENQQNEHRPSASFTFHAKKSYRSPEDKIEWKQNYLNWNLEINWTEIC